MIKQIKTFRNAYGVASLDLYDPISLQRVRCRSDVQMVPETWVETWRQGTSDDRATNTTLVSAVVYGLTCV